MTCTNCGKELDEGILFCDACGTKVLQEAPQAAPQAETPVEETVYVEQEYAPEAMEVPAPKAKKKLIPIIIGVVAVAAIAILAFFLFGGKGSTTKPILYIKDKDMFIAGKGDPWQVTEDLGVTSADYAVLAPNGKTLFYQDKAENGETNIYFRDITKESSEAQKLDSNIGSMFISKNSKKVVYIKEGSLYQHDLTDKEKIASDVASIKAVTDDLKRVIYTTKTEKEDEKPDLYISINGETEKLATEIDSFCGANKKCTVVYFIIDKTLYEMKVGGEKEKLDSDVSYVHTIYESGEIYYRKAVETEETKDGITNKKTTSELCFYDGKEVISVAADMDYYSITYAEDEPVAIYTTTEGEGDKAANVTYVVVEAEATELSFEDKDASNSNCKISKDGKMVYYVDNYDEKSQTYTLYEMAISGGAPDAAEEYDSEIAAEVSEYYKSAKFSLYKDGSVVYCKEYKDGAYDLYINQELVEYDVYYHAYYADDETLVYDTDKSTKDVTTYTLNIWTKGKKNKVAEDVWNWEYCNNGKLAYLNAYKNGKCDLYEYRKGSSEKIDEDVTALVSIILYEDKYK